MSRGNGNGRQNWQGQGQNDQSNGWSNGGGQVAVNGWVGNSNKSSSDVPGLPKNRSSPRITVASLQRGEFVDVFHRYSQDPNGYFMVEHGSGGTIHPSMGRTDCWTEARVNENWDAQRYNAKDYNTWVEICWTHPIWYNRRGKKLDTSQLHLVTQRVMPEQIRRKNEPSEAQQQPILSLVHVRWGGEQPVNPVTEGAGGWGQIGSTPSDNYINSWENNVFESIGPTYEIISIFYQNSAELTTIAGCAPILRHMCRGQHFGACYFMWPIVFQDGHEFPAYVQHQKQLHMMTSMELSGFSTRFPHPSHLYRIFTSKEWTAQMCLHPLFNCPLTTKVARQSITHDPAKAAVTAIQALSHLSDSRAAFGAQLGQGKQKAKAPQRGVAKLGWSWEAMDVTAWRNEKELAGALVQLCEQPGSLVEFVFVQEWVDFDIEIRHFVVEPQMNNPESWKPAKRIYTVFKSHEEGSFRNFDKFDRSTCLKTCMQNDDVALTEAERLADELIANWLQWIQAQTHEMPTVVRFDIMCKRTGPGKAKVTTCELTELGGCFLGWPQGPQVVFGAMLRSCFKDPENKAIAA